MSAANATAMPGLAQAIETLTEVLAQENAALERMDMQAVTGLLDAKREASRAMQSSLTAASASDSGQLKVLAQRLQQASSDNKRLLERAIRAQQHVMSILAQAARKSSAGACYGARGSYLKHSAAPSFALRANA